LKKIRSGVTTLARDVTLQLGQAVDEVTATTKNSPLTARVVVGTEAIFSRVRRCSLVVFVDFDQYLLAPRERARREGILAVAKAGRLVGARSEGRGSVMLQTRRGDDKVLQSLVAVDLTPIQVQDVIDARELEIPPFVARAEISGESAAAFVASITASSVAITSVDEVFTVTAATHEELSTALLAAVRPPGRLRLAIE
jgi:primosomal protein N'